MKKTFERFLLRSTASLLILSFGFSQIVWAADARQMLLDAKAFFEEQEALKPHGMSAQDLQAHQTQQQAVVEQQQAIEDFQNTNFSLTTQNGDVLKYVGDKLSEVKRPDGTSLANVVTDLSGHIQSADLRLADGSIQVYQNGSVLGYQTPDGNQIFYDAAGAVQKVISKAGVETLYTYIKDATGKVIETTLDNSSYQTKYDANQKIKEATRKSDNQKIYYANGIIQRIVNAGGSQTLFNAIVANSDTVVTPQGGASDVYIDAQGNKFYFTGGSVSKVVLPDNSTLDGITWDANNKIDSATLTQSDLQKFIYQSKQLTRSYDVAGVVTNYTYTASTITAAKAGNVYEYLLDKTPTKFTALDGTVTTYLTSGVYKGLKDAELTPTGVKYVYEYQGSGASTTVQRREVHTTLYNVYMLDGQTFNLQSGNPVFRTTIQFPNDNTIDQGVGISATNSGATKTLSLNLVAGTGSTFTWAGVSASFGVTLTKATDYKVEIAWESGRIGIYVYSASAAKPSTPTMTIADRAWDPKFKAVANNAKMIQNMTSSGSYNQNATVRQKDYSTLPGNPVMVFNFRPVTSGHTVLVRVKNWSPTGIVSTYDFYYSGGVWSSKRVDGSTTVASSSFVQSMTTGTDYVAEVRLENGKVNFYAYQKGQARPSSPSAFFDSRDFASFEVYTWNATGTAAEYKNLSTPVYSAAQSSALTVRTDTVKNLTLVKPAQPGSINSTDFASITYDALANLKQVIFKDASKLIFDKGVLKQAFDATGKQTDFNFQQSAISNITGSSIIQSNLTSTYGADGKLSSVKLTDLTIHYKADGTSIDWLEKTDGTEMWGLVFDANGNVTDAVIETPDGEERAYVAGKLVQLRRPDLSELFYLNSQVTKMITPEKLTYDFNYSTPGIVVAQLAGAPPVDALTPIQMQYDSNFNLKKVIRQNQEAINYLNNQIDKIDMPNQVTKLFAYTKDASGNILSYTVTQGNVITNYDTNDQPVSAVINPTADNPDAFNISYQYGKIRQVKKNGAVLFNYSYSFDAAGTEFTLIQDEESKTQKTYAGGDLISSLDNSNSVLSAYTYAAGKVSQVTVSRFGRVLHTYLYGYSGTDTLVTDEVGMKRTYDATQRMTYLEKDGRKFRYDLITPQNITVENLIENKLSDGTVVHYMDGRVSQVDQADGKVFKNFVRDASGAVTELRLYATAQDTIGAKIKFLAGQVSEVTLSDGKVLSYTYDKDTSGNVVNTWVKKGAVQLKYDALQSLQGLKINGVLDPGQILQTMTNVYDGGSDGSLSYDANFNTAQYWTVSKSLDRSQEGQTVTVYSTHAFPTPQAVTEIKYRAYSYGSGWGDYPNNNHSSGSYRVEYQLTPGGTWIEFAGASGGMGDSGVLTKTVNVSGVTAVRIYSSGYGAGSDHGGYTAGAFIYDLQFTLADLSYLSFAKTTNTSGQTTGYTLSGYNGLIRYNAAGAVTQSNAALTATQNEMASNIQNYASMPYKDTDLNLFRQTLSDTETVTLQEYSADGTLETQTKADGTVTLFENNKPSKVLDATGKTLILYTYDAAGNPTRVYLKNARDTLPDEVTKAKKNIEQQRAQSLRALASQKNLAYQSIQSQYQNQQGILQSQAAFVQSQYDSVSTTQAKGKAARSAKADALAQISGSLQSAQDALTVSFNNEADSYAALDTQVKTLSDQIDADSQNALTQLTTQETNLKKEILRQEVSPIVYDYYRRILGRDPSTAEYDSWISQIDYNSGFTPAGASVVFAGPYDYLSVPDSADFNFAGGVWTVDSWVKFDDVGARQSVFSQGDANGNYVWLLVEPGGNLTFAVSVAYGWQLILSSGLNGIKAGQWHHVAVSENGNTYRLFIDGIQVSTKSSTLRALDYPAAFRLGTNVWGGNTFKGRLEDFRVTNGLSRYNGNFSPASAPTVVDAGTKFLLKKSSSTANGIFDSVNTARVLTLSGNVSVDTVDSKFKPVVSEVRTTSGQTLTAALSTFINALPELTQRQTYVNAIKTAVTTEVNNYLAKTQAQKEAYAAALGLTAQDLIPLTTGDKDKILAWLNSRSLHFGQSAFLALESLLDQKGKVYTRETLARQCILVDILAGVISPLDDGDLVLSIFALNKVAGLYGVTLVGANLSWDDLKAIVPATATASSPRVIAHINGNHYVIITAMMADSITYIDPGIGKDKQNESITVTKAGFLKVWQGNVTLNQVDFNAVKTLRGAATQAKLLSATEAKSIRGAFWGSLLGLIGSILTWIPGLNGIGLILTGISAAVSAMEGDWISAISSLVTLGLGGFGDALKGAFNSVVKAMGPIGQVFQAAGNVIGGVYKAVTGLIGNLSNALGGFMQGIGIGSTAATQIAQFAVSKGLTIAATKGLEIIGINPQIAGFLGSMASGAIMSGIAPQTRNQSGQLVSRADMIKTSIQQASAIASIGNFGMQIGLDPIFSRILGNSLAVIQGLAIQNPTTILDNAFTLVKDQLATSLTQYSLEKLGNSLGLNPLISAAIAAPISGALTEKMSTTKWTGEVPSSANDSISINTSKIHNDTTGQDIFIPGPGTAERAWWDSVFGFLKNNVYMMAASAASAYYLAQPTLTGSGQTAPPTTTEMPLPPGATAVTYQDYFTGQTKAGYQINSSASNYIVYEKATGLPVKRVSNGVVEEGKFEGIVTLKADGSMAVDYVTNPDYIAKGQIKYSTDDGGQARFKIQDNVQEIYIDVSSPEIVLVPGTTKDTTNKILNGIVKILTLGIELSVTNGTVSKSTGGQQGAGELTKKFRAAYIFGNGFNNATVPEGTPDTLIPPFFGQLLSKGLVSVAKSLFVLLYETTNAVGNLIDWFSDNVLYNNTSSGPLDSVQEFVARLGHDPFLFIDLMSGAASINSIPAPLQNVLASIKAERDAWFGGLKNDLIDEVYTDLVDFDNTKGIVDGIVFTHSGAFQPFMKAIQRAKADGSKFDIKTIINYEGPYWASSSDYVDNPNLKRIINVWGTRFDLAPPAWSFDNAAFKGPVGITNTNIKILGAKHIDFSYSAIDSRWTPNPDANKRLEREINFKTSAFMQDLYRAAKDDEIASGRLQLFLETTEGIETINGAWVVDPAKLQYPLNYSY